MRCAAKWVSQVVRTSKYLELPVARRPGETRRAAKLPTSDPPNLSCPALLYAHAVFDSCSLDFSDTRLHHYH